MTSRGRHQICFATAMLAMVLSGCAGAPQPEISPEAAARWTPASAEAREAADRAPPLNRVAFWSDEYEKTPEDLDTALSFIDALMVIKSTERAAEIAAQTAVVHPNSPELLTVWGQALSREGRYDDAVAAYTRASDLDPSSADAYAGLGVSLDHIGEHDRAQAAYRRALALEGDRVSTRTNLGLSLLLSGDLDGAEMQLRQAVALPGADAKVRQNLALVLGLRGEVDQAREVASLDAPADLVDRNLEILQSLQGPVRDWGELGDEPAAEATPPATSTPPATTGLRGALRGGD